MAGGRRPGAPLFPLVALVCLAACAPARAAMPSLDPPGFSLSGTAVQGPPVVESFQPSGEEVPVSTPIIVRFSLPMLQSSVEDSLQVVPAAPGAVEWLDERSLQLSPASLQYSTRYQVTLGGLSVLGRQLGGIRVWTFTTGHAPPRPILAPPFTLTFDDCGTEDSIRAILAALDDRRLKAIFFPTGLCRDQFPWLVPTLLGAGHMVCNHTYSHPQLTRLSNAQIAYQIANGVHGTGCGLFRPPYGLWDGPRGRIAAIAAAQGYRVQLWDVDTRDWAGTSAQSMIDQIRTRGGIVLMHMHANLHTVEAIEVL